jgi:GT2 family glycosyltransferase
VRSDISIVIPSWNGKQLLADCLRSIESQTLGRVDTLVVDDASTDGTADMVGDLFPWVRVLRLERNSGFCVAVNAGIARVASEYVFLLNNDITLYPDCIGRLMAAAEQSGAGLLAPLILWRDQPDVIYSAGDMQRANGRPESIGFMSSCASFAYPDAVFGVSAAAGLYRREVFDRVGLFDCRFGTYFSDSDLSFRARLAGFTALFVREAVAWHVGSASLGSSTLKRTRECCVNHTLLVIKNMPAPLLAHYAPLIMRERLHQIRRLFSAARTERGAVCAAGQVAAAGARILRLMPHALRERRRIQRTRNVSAGEIKALLSP